MNGRLAVLLASLFASSAAFAELRSEAGTLVCQMDATLGEVVVSRQEMFCVYVSKTGTEHVYRGSLKRVGADLGVRNEGRLTWIVFTASDRVAPDALKGSYVGMSADMSFGRGFGANALIGGFGRGIVLQPVSIERHTGLNIAAGAARLRLW
jgi:hypothetical protein